MKPKTLLTLVALVLAISLAAAADKKVDEQREIKAILIDVERIRRMESKEQKAEIERLYRKVAPRVRDLNRYHLIVRKVDYYMGRDKLTPEEWVDKALASSPDAFMYLLWDTRATVNVILDKQRTELRPLVLADLASKDETQVDWALHVISELRAKEFFEPVLQLLAPNNKHADSVIQALRSMGEPRAIAALVKYDPDLRSVFEALRTLQRKQPADPALVARLDAKDPEVRWRAAYALSESGDAMLAGRIEKLMRDEEPRVRQYAANMGFSLENKAYQRLLPSLVALTKDPDRDVKKFVVTCLVQRRESSAGRPLLGMVRDVQLGQREIHDVVRLINDMTGTTFGYDTSETGWHPDNNRSAIRKFEEWVEKQEANAKKK